jgi:hypothetical protein
VLLNFYNTLVDVDLFVSCCCDKVFEEGMLERVARSYLEIVQDNVA